MPAFQKSVNPLTVAQQQPATIFGNVASIFSERLTALEIYPTPISAANENAPAQETSSISRLVSRLLTPVRNAFNDTTVYDVPKEVQAKSISLEYFPFVKITADLEDTTGKIHERTLWLKTDSNTWRHLRDAPTVVNTIECMKNKEKLAFFQKGSKALVGMFTAITGTNSIAPINLLGQKFGLNDLLQKLEITIKNPGYRRGNQDNEARLFADDSKYLHASITYTGLTSPRPESKDYYPGFQPPPVDALGEEIVNRFGGLLSSKTTNLLMYGQNPSPKLLHPTLYP